MASFFDAIESRLVAILEQARGATGMSAHAAAIAIPAARFRRLPRKSPTDEAELPAAAWDRGYEIRWLSLDDKAPESPVTEYDGAGLYTVRCEIRVGYLAGAALESFLKTAGTEVASDVAIEGSQRALNDALRIRRALTFAELYSGNGIVLALPDGASSIEEGPAPGRIVCVTPLRLDVEADLTNAYEPS